jgi:polysaccharide chain length determinant protein (PEP-CTERM system associated)
MLRPLLKGLTLETSMWKDTSAMMRRTLLVRENLETIARKTDIDLKAKTPEAFDEMLKRLGKQIKIDSGGDNIWIISYRNRDPKLATKVVEALLNIFVEKSLGDTRKDTSKTRQFLEKQIEEYEVKLVSAEERLRDFKQKNMALMAGGTDHFARMEAQGKELAQAKLELQEAENRRAELLRQLATVDESLSIEESVDAIPHPLDGRIQALETSLDQLLLNYTERHPDVITARRLLAELKRQKEQALLKNPEEGKGNGGITRKQMENPLYQQLKVQLGAAEGEVAALAVRVQEYERRLQELQHQFDVSLKIETEFKNLNRDYGINKKNYDELLARREQLALSDEVSQTTDDVQFNIIDPPREPVEPEGPNRPLLNIMVLAVGMGAGIGLAWLLSMLRPSIYTKRDFENITSLPVLGTVTRIWTHGELINRRMEVAFFALGCAVLLGLFVGINMLRVYEVDVTSKLAGLGIHQNLLSKIPGLAEPSL